eukprot:TRINITY_DN25444_c0_g1_i1.p1 TRINITY_DN25444_c0_g1~~TRINITY_DN25444_c0_g1_i1.p1  ORF type:complete len:1065 (-),score=410.75 TRINITY_DN25444_c0_g1_i1:108-3302(-)
MSNSTPTIKAKMGKDKALEDRGQNIQVFVRCRPLNQAEKNVKAFSIVDITSHREMVVKEKPHTNLSKSYQFDRVFGPKSQQLDVYRAVVEPLIEQVMMGYNCTVFAYGQTGTGKTFTMEGGEMRNEAGISWDSDPTSGIIPRALAQIFDTLIEQADSLEYSVRVSFLELYNEEIFDLLSAHDDTSRLRLYEDATRKGSVIIQGLEEVQVHSKSEVYSILEKGSDKRKTAETFMNAQSSRSHTVFTVTVHIKEASMMGEEVLRIGKLNLVDLAGSENVGRSGAKDARAREAGNINQSLLTLGRVISCLVERAPHIPYRESKLTRLLQDSLGGRTKTSIIATVSPATINLEETLSTLDYAYRARNITNRPEVNQMLSKREVLKGYSDEMDRLRRELLTCRDKNGVYLAKENYHEMLEKIEQQQKDITAKAQEMGALKEEMDKKEKLFEEVERCMIEKSREIQKTTEKLGVQEAKLVKVRDDLKKTAREKEEQQHLVSKHMQTEGKLGQQARKLVIVNDEFEQDLEKLHNKLSKVKDIEGDNKDTKSDFTSSLEVMVGQMCEKVDRWGEEHETSCNQLGGNLKDQLAERRGQLESLAGKVVELIEWQKAVGMEHEQEVEMTGTDGAKVMTKVDQLVENSADMGVKAGEKYKTAILPFLQQLAGKLQTQALALQHLAITVEEDLGRVKNKVNMAASDIMVAVEETDLLVRKHYEQNCELVGQLTEVNRDIVSSHVKLEQSLDVVVKEYKIHKEGVDKLGVKAEVLVKGLGEKVGPLNEAVVGSQKKVDVTSADLYKEVEIEAKEVTKKIRGSVEECLEANEGVEKAKGKLESTSGEFEVEHVEVWDDLVEGFGKVVGDRVEVVMEDSLVSKKKVEEAVSKLEMDGNKFQELLEQGDISPVDELVYKLSQNSKDMGKTAKGDIDEFEGSVSALLDTGLGTYQPTGETPGRTERQFPRYLASTSPHQRILDRYRKVVEVEEAAKLPLDESVDSAISDQSRASTATGEESHRLGSTDSLTSSVTSDWDKEVVNQENKNMFVQPKPKKRELKKPEIVRRNILGSNCSLNSLP